ARALSRQTTGVPFQWRALSTRDRSVVALLQPRDASLDHPRRAANSFLFPMPSASSFSPSACWSHSGKRSVRDGGRYPECLDWEEGERRCVAPGRTMLYRDDLRLALERLTLAVRSVRESQPIAGSP